MATLYPTEQELRRIRRHVDKGDESAKKYLKLLEVCTLILETSNGVSDARGLMGEHDDTYGEAIDDALGELMPVAYEAAAMGWQSLKYYVPNDQLIDEDKEEQSSQTEESEEED